MPIALLCRHLIEQPLVVHSLNERSCTLTFCWSHSEKGVQQLALRKSKTLFHTLFKFRPVGVGQIFHERPHRLPKHDRAYVFQVCLFKFGQLKLVT